jgi:hypothetical protein
MFSTQKRTVTICHDYQGQEIAHIKQIGVAKLTATFSMLKVQDYYTLISGFHCDVDEICALL